MSQTLYFILFPYLENKCKSIINCRRGGIAFSRESVLAIIEHTYPGVYKCISNTNGNLLFWYLFYSRAKIQFECTFCKECKYGSIMRLYRRATVVIQKINDRLASLMKNFFLFISLVCDRGKLP